MATRYAADTIAEAKKYEAETKADAKHTDVRAGKHSTAAGQNNEEHCADSLG